MQTCGEYVILVLCGCENGAVWPECLAGTVDIGCSDAFYGSYGLTAGVFLTAYLTITEHLGYPLGGEGVYTRYAYAVQTAGNLV